MFIMLAFKHTENLNTFSLVQGLHTVVVYIKQNSYYLYKKITATAVVGVIFDWII